MTDESDRERRRHRLQTATERELESERARRERSSGVPRDEFETDDITGKYSGDDLDTMRSRRPTPERFLRLERKADELAQDIKDTKGDLGEVKDRMSAVEKEVSHFSGQMEVFPKLIESMDRATTAMQKREHVTFKAQVDVDTAKAINEDKVVTERRLDAIDERKAKRRRNTKIIAGIVALVSSGGLVHWLLEKL